MAKVDAEDYERLLAVLWRTHNGYAVHRVGSGVEFMHRVALNLTRGDGQVDHINGDRLDNRKANLRVVTHAQNGQNRRPVGGTSQHRGVSWNAQRECWVARVNVGRQTMQRYCKTESEAAQVARDWRIALMPYAVEGETA
jgi:hypothetical protein